MSEAIILRPATIEDAEILLDWRNDAETRRVSHKTSEVTIDEHAIWLSKILGNANRRLLVAEKGGVSVGALRADLSDGVWELSWTVAPKARGRGIAKRMVTLLAAEISGPIRAEIKACNTASARIAEYAGMVLNKEVEGILHFSRAALK